MPLTEEENKRFEANIKKSAEKKYVKTIQTLMDIHYEDRLVIYTILAVLAGYIQNIDFSNKEKDYHFNMMNQMFIDYEINEPEDLVKGINKCMANIQAAKMRYPIGGIQ